MPPPCPLRTLVHLPAPKGVGKGMGGVCHFTHTHTHTHNTYVRTHMQAESFSTMPGRTGRSNATVLSTCLLVSSPLLLVFTLTFNLSFLFQHTRTPLLTFSLLPLPLLTFPLLPLPPPHTLPSSHSLLPTLPPHTHPLTLTLTLTLSSH